MLKRFAFLFIIGLIASIPIGCGSGGGTAGDENDPETTSDAEQMEDETDEEVVE